MVGMRLRDEHIRTCTNDFIYINDSFILSRAFASHLPICLQHYTLSPVSGQAYKRHLIDITSHWGSSAVPSGIGDEGCLEHLQLPLSFIQALDHSRKNTSFGEVMTSVHIGGDGRRETQKEGGGRSNSIILSPFYLHHSFLPAPTHTRVPQSFLLLSILPW